MLLCDSHYVIRARDGFRQRLATKRAEIAGYEDVLLGPLLWANAEPGGGCATVEEYARAIKILYVLYARDVVMVEAGISWAVPQGTLSAEDFDRWWELESLGGVDHHTRSVLRETERADGMRGLEVDARELIRRLIR